MLRDGLLSPEEATSLLHQDQSRLQRTIHTMRGLFANLIENPPLYMTDLWLNKLIRDKVTPPMATPQSDVNTHPAAQSPPAQLFSADKPSSQLHSDKLWEGAIQANIPQRQLNA